MSAAAPATTFAEYLRAEAESDVRHEYVGGRVLAMASSTPEHSRLAASVIGVLGQALRARACTVYNCNVRVRIEETDRSTYPDVSVVCGPRTTAKIDPDALTNPAVVVEVLSDSTEADDRGEKFAHYRRLPSLREYVLVSQRTPRIEVYRREGAEWVLSEASSGQRARIPSLGVELSVDEVYRDPSVP